MRKRQKRPIFDEKKSYNNRGSKKDNKLIHSTYTYNMIREKTVFLPFTNKFVVILKKCNPDLCFYLRSNLFDNTNIKLILLGILEILKLTTI